MKQDDEDTGIGIKLVPGSYGMNVPSTCTIVIIAGITINKTKYFRLRLTDEVSSERPKRDLRLT